MGCGEAKAPLQKDLPWCRIHEIIAANLFARALIVSVSDCGEVTGNETVPAPDDKISRFQLQTLSLLTLQAVPKGDCLLVREGRESADIQPGRTA